jgi:hypothetical protein
MAGPSLRAPKAAPTGPHTGRPAAPRAARCHTPLPGDNRCLFPRGSARFTAAMCKEWSGGARPSGRPAAAAGIKGGAAVSQLRGAGAGRQEGGGRFGGLHAGGGASMGKGISGAARFQKCRVAAKQNRARAVRAGE